MGEQRVLIRIAEGEEIDVGALHQLLRNEIDAREHRIPLDLRGVHGVPGALIDVLIESQRYAQARGKRITISYALPEMREALNPRRRTDASSAVEVVAPDAGTVARSLLDQRHADDGPSYDIDKAERIQRDRSSRKVKVRRARDYAILGAIVLVIAAAIGAIEWVIVFNHSPDIVVPRKSFESNIP